MEIFFNWGNCARRPPRACHVGVAVPGPRAHVEAPEDPTVQGPRRHHCAARANDASKKPRSVPRGLCALAGGRTSIRHCPPVHRTSQPSPRPCWSSCRPRRWGESASTRHRAYKTLPSFLPRAPEHPATRCRPPLVPPVIVLLRSHP
jgi:hypothetical protein